MTVYTRGKNGCWYSSFQYGGKRYQFPIKDAHTEREAKEKAAWLKEEFCKRWNKGERDIDIQAGKIVTVVRETEYKLSFIAGAVEARYWRIRQRKLVNGFSRSYIRVKKIIEMLDNPLVTTSELPHERWERVKTELKNTRNESTVNHYIKDLKFCLNKAREWGLITQPLYLDFTLYKEPRGNDRILTYDEEKDLSLFMSTKCSKDEAVYCHLFLFLLETGMRLNEALNLRQGDIDIAQATVTVRSEISKTGKPRILPLNARAFHVLQRYPSGFVTWSGKVFLKEHEARFIWERYRAYTENLEDKQFTIHCLRHTYASKMLKSGVELLKVSRLLGHRSLASTERYSHFCVEDLRV